MNGRVPSWSGYSSPLLTRVLLIPPDQSTSHPSWLRYSSPLLTRVYVTSPDQSTPHLFWLEYTSPLLIRVLFTPLCQSTLHPSWSEYSSLLLGRVLFTLLMTVLLFLLTRVIFIQKDLCLCCYFPSAKTSGWDFTLSMNSVNGWGDTLLLLNIK